MVNMNSFLSLSLSKTNNTTSSSHTAMIDIEEKKRKVNFERKQDKAKFDMSLILHNYYLHIITFTACIHAFACLRACVRIRACASIL